jgi:uncharacterized protein (DUF58 family)
VRSARLAVGLGLALCLAGAGFAATPLYLPGVALLLIAAAAATWVSNAARGVRLVRSLGSPAVEERVDLPVTVTVSRSRVPLPGAEVRAWPGGAPLPVSGSDDGTASAAVRFPRRGRHKLGPASLLVTDPLGLCGQTISSSADEVLVLPRVEPVRLVDVGGEPTILGRHVVSATDAGATEVDSLRPHRPGTPASRIHWPTVARTTTLMERRLVADGERFPLVVVDPRQPASADALDQGMRAAASLCVHLARRGGCALLLPGDRRPTRIDAELFGFSQLHARLALLAPEAGAPPLGCLSGASVVLWVTAASRRPAELAQVRAPVRYLVAAHAQERWPVQFTVAGFSGQRLERITATSRAA